MFNRVLYFSILAGFLAGCAGGLQGVMVLRSYSSEQAQTAAQVKLQEGRFSMLMKDIGQKRISAGLRYDDVLRRYGEPVLAWDMEMPSLISKKLLYRNPVEYFSTDRVYLYFDNAGCLVKWEYCPASRKSNENTDAKKSN